MRVASCAALCVASLLMLPCSSSVARAAEWKPLAQSLITEQKPGYGGLCGVLVERTSGDVYLNVSDRGLFRSTDQGANWKRVGEEFKGRTETPGCMLFDPTGKSKRMLIALVYGGPIILAPELSSTWSTLDKKVNHVDWAAIDWVDPQPKFVLTLKHESGGDLLASHDGGKSFSEVAKGYGPGWVFDATTAVVAQAKSRDKASGGLVRTTDGGKTFSACGEYSARANPRLYDGTLYWLTENSLIATTDQGQTWKKLSDVKGGLYGPVFGHTAKQMFLVTSAGVVESTDGGATWGTAIALPKEMKGASVMTWLDYDPKHDLLYTVKMSSDLYSLEHK